MPDNTCSTYVGVAFLRGSPHSIAERFIMEATGGPYVHTEFILQSGADVRLYTAANIARGDRVGGFMPSARLRTLPDPARWEIVRFPVTPAAYAATYALVLQLLSMQLPYNARDLWQCCVKLMLPFERDLDCNRVDTWRSSGVFCSQVCLLLLRRLAGQGLLPCLEPRTAADLDRVNSRGCSPNTLHRLVAP